MEAENPNPPPPPSEGPHSEIRTQIPNAPFGPIDVNAPGARWAQRRAQTLSTPEGRRNWQIGRDAALRERQRLTRRDSKEG
jgi:hypothetical protein